MFRNNSEIGYIAYGHFDNAELAIAAYVGQEVIIIIESGDIIILSTVGLIEVAIDSFPHARCPKSHYDLLCQCILYHFTFQLIKNEHLTKFD